MFVGFGLQQCTIKVANNNIYNKKLAVLSVMSPQELVQEQPDKSYSISSFILKTYKILNDPQNASQIEWCEDGTSFIVKNIQALTQKVLPRYFRHNKYESFIRQLNMYDFAKTKNITQHKFKNQYFIRDRQDLLKFIKRKREKKNRKESFKEVCMRIQKSNSQIMPCAEPLHSVEITEPQNTLISNNDDKIQQQNVTASKQRRVQFSESVRDVGDQNYWALIEASSKWINTKSDNCWSNIRSFKSFKISLKVLEYDQQKNKDQNLQLHERAEKRKSSILLHECNQFNDISNLSL